MRSLFLQQLPIGMYTNVWLWLYQNDIGNMRKQSELTGGEVDEVILSEEEVLAFTLKFSGK